ncbi:putative RNA methyltransferase [Dellaglioa algida]|uniref:RNA methyltransferase n=3 Tax=Dellaglioa TaxID=2767880 RepID=A0A0R1HRK0_9LACO|nr:MULTISPECIES: 23S rRNA (uracil(1939)-C(5))-methyltransferase RlmD [Dellaglioa]KRK46065.1 RNA methyltransferase [Dellaglioa algida DSM 15638]MCZ2491605.1 23S rRNA (uracil(1939)-C(5))-methyltransferase RlmD [Dellaglioa carnosa]MCZ2492154.1 23S rRNA (uracil(1939)-C(5))-methyltransferase RlmD [Dellaglioa carnosa]MCZ2494682.1 23S rRNA (uracil(1939)-C(5))-methyltransferase RlmD [Dellaglioa carnosa]MDK1717003.1 23S rRNA (uracil(1939)-C(5))-methyltransferase RlmD [Dellaglioa algida]
MADNQEFGTEIEAGSRFPLTIKRLGINGEGIGYYKRKITFVPGALPDEVVVAEVTSVSPTYINAKIHKIRKQSPVRVEPKDSTYGEVGGIELEHLNYQGQLDFKKDVIVQSLERYKPRGYEHYDLKPTIGMQTPYEYRNKAQFQVREQDGHVIAGLYKPKSHDLVDLKEFSTQRPTTMLVIRHVVALLEELEIPIYNEEAKSGIIKTLAVRESFDTGEVQLTFITNSSKLPKKRELIMHILEELPMVTSVMQNINKGETSLVWGDETINIAGQDFIMERLGKMKFKLSARAFFQLNPVQTGVLYDEINKALNLDKNESLVDAYCGVGTVGLYVAHGAKEVRGMDTTPEAIEDARENAILSHQENTTYEVGKAEDILPKWLEEGFVPDALVVDPPRTGLDDQLIEAINKSRPKKFVYVSCNPSTLAKDLELLTKSYRVDYIQSVDMFPQTSKVEAVVKLSRRSSVIR